MRLMGVKRAMRSAFGVAAPAIWRRSRQHQLAILTYHRVLPEGHRDTAVEQPGMWVRPETFTMHLDVLRKHFDVVDLDQWLLDKAAGKPLPSLACAITFDDGWRDNYQYAFPALQQAGVPATIFVVTGLVGTNHAFWPNRIARILHERWLLGPELPASWPRELLAILARVPSPQSRAMVEAIDSAINACKGSVSDEQMACWLDEIEVGGEDGSKRDLLTWAELDTMVQSGIMRVGSHTRRHIRFLPGIAPELIAEEVSRAYQDLAARFPNPSRVFCYPNGDYFEQAVETVARFHQAAVTTVRGWNRTSTDPYKLKRVSMHEDIADSPRRFIAAVSALL